MESAIYDQTTVLAQAKHATTPMNSKQMVRYCDSMAGQVVSESGRSNFAISGAGEKLDLDHLMPRKIYATSGALQRRIHH